MVGPVDQIWLLGNGIQIMMVDLVDLVFGDAVPEGVVQISIWVKMPLQMHSKMSSPKNFPKLMPHDSRALHPAMMVNWAVLLIGQINMLRGRTAKLYLEISTIQPTSAAIAEGNFTAACVLCTMLREERSCDDQHGQL